MKALKLLAVARYIYTREEREGGKDTAYTDAFAAAAGTVREEETFRTGERGGGKILRERKISRACIHGLEERTAKSGGGHG